MSRTASEIIAIVRGRLGQRANGQIGGRSLESAALDAINDGILDISRKENVPELLRNASISMSTSDNVYAVPTQDSDGNTIRIKDILRIRAKRTSETTAWTVRRLSQRRFDALYPEVNSDHIGEPRFYMVQDQDIEFAPYPDQTYELAMRVSIWPVRITINQTQPYPEEFDDVIEAFVTSDLMASLQLNDDAELWRSRYFERLGSTLQAIRAKPDWEPSVGPDSYQGSSSTDPARDPFTSRWP